MAGNLTMYIHLAAEYGRWNGKDHYGNLWETNAIGTKYMLHLQEKVDDHVYAAGEFYGFYGDHTAFDVEDDK